MFSHPPSSGLNKVCQIPSQYQARNLPNSGRVSGFSPLRLRAPTLFLLLCFYTVHPLSPIRTLSSSLSPKTFLLPLLSTLVCFSCTHRLGRFSTCPLPSVRRKPMGQSDLQKMVPCGTFHTRIFHTCIHWGGWLFNYQPFLIN
jgi:hypothetical protein